MRHSHRAGAGSFRYGRARRNTRQATRGPSRVGSVGTGGHKRGRIAQLTRDLAEANEQQAATSQVLEVIGRSDFRLEPVFETVVRHAVRLSHADCGYVYQPDGDVYRIAFIIGGTPEYREYMRRASGAPGS